MKKNIKKLSLFILILFVFVVPSLSLAGGLVTCTDNCGWNDLLATVNTVVNFVIFKLAMPISAIMFAYAGFELIASGGSSEKKEKAKGIFINVVIGIVFAAAAWLIIHTISSILGYNGSWIGF